MKKKELTRPTASQSGFQWNFRKCRNTFQVLLPPVTFAFVGQNHWLINYVNTKAKFFHLKNLLYTDFSAGVYLSEAPSPPWPHNPLPLTHCIRAYCTFTQTEKGVGGELNQERRLEGQQSTKLGRKYQHDRLYLQSINSDKYLPQSSFTGQFFRLRHFASVSVYTS